MTLEAWRSGFASTRTGMRRFTPRRRLGRTTRRRPTKVHETVRYGAGVGKVYPEPSRARREDAGPSLQRHHHLRPRGQGLLGPGDFHLRRRWECGTEPFTTRRNGPAGATLFIGFPWRWTGWRTALRPLPPLDGERSNSMVRDYSIDTTYGLKLTSAECYPPSTRSSRVGAGEGSQQYSQPEAGDRRQKVIFPHTPSSRSTWGSRSFGRGG